MKLGIARATAAFYGVARLGLVCTLAGVGRVPAEEPAHRDVVEKAYRLRLDGKLDEAEKTLQDFLEKRPRQANAWLELARLRFEKSGTTREIESARTAIAKAIGAAPDNAALHRWAARIAMINAILHAHKSENISEHVKEAATEAEQALKLDPNDHEARRMLVSIYGNNPSDLGGDLERAKAQVEELDRRSPVDGLHARCELELKHDPNGKLELWKRFVEQHENDARAQEGLALAYAWIGDSENAHRHAEKTLTLDSSRSKLLLDVARAFALTRRPKVAEPLLVRYVELEPPPPVALRAWAWMALGQLQRQRGDLKTSAESLVKAKTIHPYCWFTMTPPPAELFAAPR